MVFNIFLHGLVTSCLGTIKEPQVKWFGLDPLRSICHRLQYCFFDCSNYIFIFCANIKNSIVINVNSYFPMKAVFKAKQNDTYTELIIIIVIILIKILLNYLFRGFSDKRSKTLQCER